jgi:hypothetical protein
MTILKCTIATQTIQEESVILTRQIQSYLDEGHTGIVEVPISKLLLPPCEVEPIHYLMHPNALDEMGWIVEHTPTHGENASKTSTVESWYTQCIASALAMTDIVITPGSEAARYIRSEIQVFSDAGYDMFLKISKENLVDPLRELYNKAGQLLRTMYFRFHILTGNACDPTLQLLEYCAEALSNNLDGQAA